MTAPAPPPERPAAKGTVFDIGYQRYSGVREGRGRSRRAVIKDGWRIGLGLGRGPRAKALPWAFITLLAVIGLVMALIAGATNRYIGPGMAEQLNLPSHSDYYGFASIVVFLFAAVVAPELLCRDRREGAIHLYLVRPITAGDYVVARWIAFLLLTLLACWLPQLILLLGLALGDPAPGAYLQKHWLDIPRFLLAGLVMAAYTTTLALLTASFTTRRAYASIFLVGLFVITTPLTAGAATEIQGKAGQWISMFNLSNIPVHVNDVIFGEVSKVTSIAPARALGAPTLVGWYLLWTVVPGLLLWGRYRRLSP